MTSSLAQQLAKNASLNATLYADRGRRKASPSYLFTGRDADEYDLETIYSIGVNSFLHLTSVYPPLEAYEDALFSERAKSTDRTLLSPDAIAELDKALGDFLVLLGPYLMEAPTGRVLEFLVRRFRIHEFNIDSVMALFLPYHETPHFTKMLSILDLKPGSVWGFLIPYKSAAQNIKRVSLVSEMLKNVDLARFITSLLPAAIREVRAHRTLVAFNAATLHEFIKRSKSLEEGTVAYLLSGLLEPLQQKSEIPSKDTILGSYILLSALSEKCELAPPALKVVVAAMASMASHVPTKQFVSAVLAVCEPQNELEKLSESTATAILKLQGINAEITAACRWHGIEKILLPLITRVISRISEPTVTEFIENLVTSPSVPEAILTRLTSSLIQSASFDACPLAERRLLGALQQRYPSVVQKVTKRIIEQDEASKDVIEQLTLSLSVTQSISTTHTTPNSDIIVASTYPDANVRVIAVKKLVVAVSEANLPAEEVNSVHNALLARVFDANIDVLEALYSNSKVLSKTFLSINSEYVGALAKAIASPGVKPKRAALRLHLAFLTDHILAHLDGSQKVIIFQRIIVPFLLFSKPRQHTAELIWDSIVEKASLNFELLKGVEDIWAKEKASERTAENMAALNTAIASRIAENIMCSDEFSNHLAAFAGKLGDENPWTRSLAFLTLHALVGKLSGSHQLQAGKVVLEALALEGLPAVDDLTENQSFDETLRAETIGKSLVAKPNSKTTLAWLQIALINAVAKIPRPGSRSIDWFKPVHKASTDPYDCYVCSVKKVYSLASKSSGSLPVISMDLLQVLFGTVGDDALVFLAGVWSSQDVFAAQLRTLSLLHATSFLEAHAQEQDGVDFQTVLPMFLIALQNSDAQDRAAGLECISRLRVIAGGKLTQVYKFDVVYGPQNQDLQYLDQDDLKRYLDALLEHRDYFQGDAAYLGQFHGQYLVKNSGDKKRDAEYRKRVLSYLLSHINAVSSPVVQNSLLGSLRAVQDRSKLQLLLPAIQSLLAPSSAQSEELSSALLSSFNASIVKDLNEKSKPFWKVFVDLLKKYLPFGVNDASANALVQGLRNGLSDKLDQSRKVDLCNALQDICNEYIDSHAICKELMTGVLSDVPVTVSLLAELAPKVRSTDRALKRVKTAEAEEPSITKLTFFTEALNAVALPGSVELISHLLQALSSVVQTFSSVQADVNYTEQLLMAAVDNAASKVTELPNIAPSAIRLDVLVELIRVTDNPQTFHQALILMANLTRLAPDSVLHNIMPVFTFMGSNVFHRDDASSFNVVQKTIDGIVPIMVASLKKSAGSPMELVVSAKAFLHIFTDAANHIPRHRRTKFFSHLVSALGAEDFLAPVCMLLVEKQASKIARQTEDESKASLSLAVALLTGSALSVRIQAVIIILEEVERLRTAVVRRDAAVSTFLSISDSDPAAALLANKRRAQALLILVGQSFHSPLTSAQDIPLDAVVSQLMLLSTMPQGSEEKLRDLASAAHRSLGQLLSVMPAMSFLTAIASILQSEDSTVQTAALDLLSQRVPTLASRTRQVASSTIIQILGHLKRLVPRESDIAVPSCALKALRSLATTMEKQEQGAAAEIVPLVLRATSNSKLAEDAWQGLLPLSRNLGPRIIPYFRAIVQASLAALQSEAAHAPIVQSTLQGLLSSIPTFWASGEVLSLFNLYIDQSIGSNPSSSLTLVKAMTKRVPAKILLPTLLEMWPPVQNPLDLDRMAAFFHLVFRTLHGADRVSVLEQLRPLFKMFMEALSFASPDHKVEANIIFAFRELVVKLNETAFRPLFRRLYDWAFAAETDDVTRKVVFIHLYLGLQEYFKGLMSPYMSFLLQPFEEILKAFSVSGEGDQKLWAATIRSLLSSLNHDDSGFWRNDKLRQIATTLTAQVASAINFNFADGKDVLKDCLIALVEAANDDTLVKTINMNILMHTRSEDARLRLYALSCDEAIWRASGMKLLGFVAETATFIAECSEDENDVVVRESLKLKHAVESVAGKIDEL